ncbi:DUF1080 domain-containing protein [Planctomyces sp. SH-PL62]|uniref:3-keto-disaccharide hydrolase n=1 Tax=Planctomyces sp. SH-PL62 TaxID=1636152 RepID=UPI00078E4932|nr:DUF1080 domain-containing protein [Planctomyces sp. SH-PL62]AMV37866.1 hypothetical protein VT85_10540 [Planctomyces sp. SH-PL62]
MTLRRPALMLAATLVAGASAFGYYAVVDDAHKPGYKDTPYLPGHKWRVHDADRPHPPVVTPGSPSTDDAPGKAPSDAVVLFDGKDLSKWRGDHGEPRWEVADGAIVAKGGAGTLISREEFGDCQVHIEWAAPNPPKGNDQGRGNSGVMLFGRYEIQVLDNFNNPTYADGHAGAVYGQHPPLVNAVRPPGQWQAYDILFTAPRFKGDGSVETPAYVTVLVNGVVVQNHAEIYGAVAFRDLGRYQQHGPKGPLVLQDHGDPVRFRNIWIRPLKAEDQD